MDEARQELETFVKLEEESGHQSGEAYYSLGIFEMQRGNVKGAKMLVQKAIDTDPSVSHFNNAMGDVYLLESDPKTAIVYYKKAIEKDEKYAIAYSGLGEAQALLGEKDKAIESYHKALELRPSYAVVEFKLGKLYTEKEPAEAIKHFEKYLASGKNLEFKDQASAAVDKLKQTSQPTKP